MDLQTQRRLEDFLKLLDIPYSRLAERMEFIDPPFRFYLEVLNQRILITLTLPLEAPATENALPVLLAQCQPERFQAVPLRCFVTKVGLTASFSPHPESPSQSWFALYRTLKQVLITAKQNSLT